MSRKFLVSFSIFLCFIINCTAYEVVNSTQIKIEQQSGLKNYEEEEDGKVLPYRYITNANNYIKLLKNVPKIPN